MDLFKILSVAFCRVPDYAARREDIRLSEPAPGQPRELHLTRLEHAGRPARCSRCHKPAPGDDRQPERATWPGAG